MNSDRMANFCAHRHCGCPSTLLLWQNRRVVILSGRSPLDEFFVGWATVLACLSISMRFSQVDRITELTPGESITAVRCLSLVEEYLKDHFPRFPVMPGVLAVEALFQASMWLVRVTDQFEHAVVALRQTNNMKFSGFVQPGDQMVLNAKIKSHKDGRTRLKVVASVGDQVTTSGILILESYNLADRNAGAAATDDFMKNKFRLTYKRLCNQLDPDGLSRFAELSA